MFCIILAETDEVMASGSEHDISLDLDSGLASRSQSLYTGTPGSRSFHTNLLHSQPFRPGSPAFKSSNMMTIPIEHPGYVESEDFERIKAGFNSATVVVVSGNHNSAVIFFKDLFNPHVEPYIVV